MLLHLSTTEHAIFYPEGHPGFGKGYEGTMVNQYIEQLYQYLGNEPMAPWIRIQEFLVEEIGKKKEITSYPTEPGLLGMYQMRTLFLEDQGIT